MAGGLLDDFEMLSLKTGAHTPEAWLWNLRSGRLKLLLRFLSLNGLANSDSLVPVLRT